MMRATPTRNIIVTGHVLDVLRGWADESVQCAVTSPPYWGLRDYKGAPDVVWGGEQGCDHEWGEEAAPAKPGQVRDSKTSHDACKAGQASTRGAFCTLCGAWRGQLGLEPTPALYVEHITEIFREVRRVLRKDGALFLNLGDSYATKPHGPKNANSLDPKYHEARNRGGCAPRPNRLPQPGLKHKDLIGMPWRVAFALQEDGWTLRSDIVWCLSGGTSVYAKTQKGEAPSKLKDLVRLRPETVKLWNGEKWTQVLSWSENKSCNGNIEFQFRSGERLSCTSTHEWPTNRGLLKSGDIRVGDIVKMCTLPEPAEPKRPSYLSKELLWSIGLYLAEGSQGGYATQFSLNAKDERWMLPAISKAATDAGATMREWTYGSTLHVSIFGSVFRAIIETYIGGKTAIDKHLSNAAWMLPNDDLRLIIDGYLAGDGSSQGARFRLGFCRNYQLERDLRTASARLGATLTLNLSVSKFQNGSSPSFLGEWRWTRSGHRNEKDRGEIVAIRKAKGGGKYWDVAVEDEPHLFSLGSGLLTHNSKPNCMPSSVTDRPTTAHEYVFLFAKSRRYFYDAHAIREPVSERSKGISSGNRVRVLRADRDGVEQHLGASVPWRDADGHRNARTVWDIPTKPFAAAHFATFPPALAEKCIIAGSPEKACGKCGKPWERETLRVPTGYDGSRYGKNAVAATGGAISGGTKKSTLGSSRGGMTAKQESVAWQPACSCSADPAPALVLDPFAGSGTVAAVCVAHGRDYLGIDINPEYQGLQKDRVEKAREAAAAPKKKGRARPSHVKAPAQMTLLAVGNES